MKKKFSRVIAHHLPQCLLLFSILTSNVLFPATVIAQEIENTNNVTQEETVPIDTSEDILEEGISTSIYEEEEVVEPLFVFENGIYTVKNVVQGEEYVYPDNNDVRVKFTEVTQEGNLVIKRVELTEEQKELLNTKDSYGWDITSSMSNGTFKYNLTLPNTHGNEDIEVKYTEDNNTYESIDNSNIEIKSNVVTIEGLDHFTMFVVTKTLPTGVLNGGVCTVASIEGVCYDTIQGAINAANPNGGDTINLLSDFTIPQQININKSLTLNGNNHTIFSEFTEAGSNNNSAIGIFADNVTLNNLTIDGSNGKRLHGINVYEATNVVLNNITLKNNKKAGLVVNGSDVTVNNIKTSNNGWYAINVDQGSGVTSPSQLTITGVSIHDEAEVSFGDVVAIYIDNRAKNVSVNPINNNQYYYYDYDLDFFNIHIHNRVYLLDKTPPSVPVLESPIGGTRINNNTLIMQWKDSTDSRTEWPISYSGTGVSGYYLEIYPNCTDFNNVSTCQPVYSNTMGGLLTSSEYQASNLPENTYFWRVKAVDKAGNESNWSNLGKFIIDTPPVFSLSGIKYTYLENGVQKTVVQDRYITNWNTPTFVGELTSTDIDSVKVVIEGTEYSATYTATINNDMTWETTISNPLRDGSYNVMIIATDLAENTTTIEKELIIDTKAPSATYTYYKNGTPITSTKTFVKSVDELSFTAIYTDESPSSGILKDSYVIFDSNEEGTARTGTAYCDWRNPDNTLMITTNTLEEFVPFTNCEPTLADGQYYVYHQIYDNATRKDIPSITQYREVKGLHFIVDSTAPTIPTATFTANGVSVPTNGYTRSKTFTFNLSSTEDTTRYQLKYWNDISGSPYKESNPWNPTDLSDYSTELGVYNGQFTQGEGKHYFSFSACDAVGNCSAYSDPFIIYYDTHIPTATLTSAPGNYSYVNGDFEVSGTAQDNVALSYVFFDVRTKNGSTWVSGCKSGTNNLTYSNDRKDAEISCTIDTKNLVNGTTYMLRIHAGDYAGYGNVNSEAVRYFTMDKTGPTVPVLQSPIGGAYIKDNTPLMQWANSSDDYSDVKGYYYRVFRNCLDINDSSTCSGVYPDLTGLWRTDSEYQAGRTLDGTYYWQVMAEDNAGNKSNWSNLEKVTIDTKEPSKPEILKFLNPNLTCGSVTNSNIVTVDWSDSSDENGSGIKGYEYQVNYPTTTGGRSVWTYMLQGTSSYFRGSLNEGTHYIRVRAQDMAGNWSEWSDEWVDPNNLTEEEMEGNCSITHDSIRPSQPVITNTPENAFTNINAITVNWEGGDDQGTNPSGIKGYIIGYVFTSADENTVTDWTSGLVEVGNPKTHSGTYGDGEGKYVIYVKTVDNAGNESPESEPYTITYDKTAPVITLDTYNTDWTNGNITVNALTNEGTLNSDSHTFTENGSFDFIATDSAGNSTTKTVTITNIDKTNPTVDSISISNGLLTVTSTDLLSGVKSVEVQINSGEWITYTLGMNLYSFVDNTPGTTHTVNIRVTDNANNTTTSTTSFTIPTPEVLGATTGPSSTPTTKTNVSTYALGIGSGKDTLEQEEETNVEETPSIEEPSVLGERCENKKKVSGYVYIDKNKDKEMNENEEGIKDITLTIQYTDEEGNIKTEEEVNTDEKGYWETQLCSGKYNIVVKKDTLPKNIEVAEVLSLTVSDNEEETIFNIQALDTRNFWQKYWYLIVGGLAIIAIGYISLKNRKKEEI